MASNSRLKTYNRDFLNSDKGMAAYAVDVEIWHPTLSYVTFHISDCNRQVTLDFSYEDQDTKDRMLAKV
jgi:hypothetical protein